MTRRIFALVGDTHADGTNRLDEHNEVMKWICWDAKGRGAQALFHTGDVYERTTSPVEREAVIDWVMLAGSLFPTVIVSGNHDDPKDIEALGKLNTPFRIYAETRPGPLLPVEAGSAEAIAWIAVLPWPRKAYLLAGEGAMSREDGNAQAATALRNILRGYGDAFRGLHDELTPRIFLGHVMMRGSRVSVSQPPLVGADFELGTEDLALAGASFYGLGHIHLGQDWSLADVSIGIVDLVGAPAVYPGSPMRKNWGELEDKSYVLITFDDGTLVGWERIATPCQKMMHASATYIPAWREAGIGDGPIEFPEAFQFPGDFEDPPAGAAVRLRYECRADQRSAARKGAEFVRDKWLAAGAAEVKLEEVVIVEQRARAPEVVEQPTNRGRLEAYWASKQREPERRESLLAKLAELEAQS